MSLWLLLTSGSAAAQGTAPASVGSIVGVWKLVESWSTDSAGRRYADFGEPPPGWFVYTSTGDLMIQMAANPPLSRIAALTRRDRADSTRLREMEEALRGYLAYLGTYTVDAAQGVVTHHVQADVRRQFTGTDQPRPFRVSGDTLVIGNDRFRRVLVRVGGRP